ncbi:MAG: DUF5655 domain-containing protein [Acidimicrobiales bacterium]
MTLDDYFETGPEYERPVFEAVMRHLELAGPIHVEPVSVGIFLKNPRKFAELRPMTKWVAISFFLPRRANHRTITRKVTQFGAGYHHVANVARPEDVDDPLGGFLVEAYQLAAGQ